MDVKKNVAGVLDKTPIIGEPIKEVLLASKDTMRWLLYRSSGLVSGPTMFENLGFVYLGPVDGHDLESLEENLRAAKAAKSPCLSMLTPSRARATLLRRTIPERSTALPPML